jgi:hypothetical protein
MKKQERKLIKQQNKAEECTSREEAQAILRKHQKAEAKLLLKKLLKK